MQAKSMNTSKYCPPPVIFMRKNLEHHLEPKVSSDRKLERFYSDLSVSPRIYDLQKNMFARNLQRIMQIIMKIIIYSFTVGGSNSLKKPN